VTAELRQLIQASMAAVVVGALAHAPGLAREVAAQAPKPPDAPAARPVPPAPAGYTYNPEGRRDPFVSLLSRGSDIKTVSVRPEGLPGLSVSDIAIRGIVANRGSYVAMIEAADGRTYTIRSGDKLYDATVKAVLADVIVFVQQVNDPLSLVKQREIRKPLRPTEEGK
jgi:Tfp pilus assembly protein PilP